MIQIVQLGMAAPIAALPLILALTTPSLAQDEVPPAEAMFIAPETSTNGAAVAVGRDGTVHMAAATYNHGGDGVVIYATCTEACAEDDATWRRVEIPAGDVIRTEIAVTPAGAPRLLITVTGESGGRDFLYAECGPGLFGGVPDGCYTPDGWRIGRIAGNYESSMGGFFEYTLPTRSFALDPAGAPRFIYVDANYVIEPDHYGAFYMSCDASCTDPANWTETDLANHLEYDTEQFTRPVLAMGPNGSAHLLAWVYGFEPDGTDIPDDLYYYECLADCGDRANWSRVSLLYPGSGSYPSPTWDIATDAQGRPRAALFVGGGAHEEGIDYSLLYLWCNEACTSDTGWSATKIYEGSMGESPAITIDPEGRPHVAFLSDQAMPVIAECDADCEGDAPVWNGTIFEDTGHIADDRPTALPFTCDGELWNALSPDLALAPDGTAYVAYDISVEARCLYQEFGEPEITYEFHEIWRGVRLATPEIHR
jgi:hypothetical protein